MTTPGDRLERYLQHLDSIFLVEPKFFPLDPPADGGPKVVCMVYPDLPEAGMITGVTYGLSEGSHEKWVHGRPELMIAVESLDLAWPLAVADMARGLRGSCPFCYGDVINFGEQISPESEMSGFLIFVPGTIDNAVALGIDVGGEQPINIAGAYPIYDSERPLVAEMGLQQFWRHPNFDMYDVHRSPVVR